jgi:hypothetical protein
MPIRRTDPLDAFRGLLMATAIGVPFWAMVFWIIC